MFKDEESYHNITDHEMRALGMCVNVSKVCFIVQYTPCIITILIIIYMTEISCESNGVEEYETSDC